MSFAPDDLTSDALLGGQVHLLQPQNGYRAATDAVLLAAIIDAQMGQRVLDVGCGAGAVSACLNARISGLSLHGLEVQPDYAALARQNVPDMTVWDGDLFDLPDGIKDISFDWVMTNPPFFSEADAASPDIGRDTARRQIASARDWAEASLRRVRSGGRIAIIQRTENLPELLAGLNGAGDIAVLPLQSRPGRDAKRLLVTARKGARGIFRVMSPLILHEGDRHGENGDDFSLIAQNILRKGHALRAT